MQSLRVQCFGKFEVSFADRPVTAFESQKVRALLAYLSCRRDRAMSRDHLAAFLWPEKGEDAARRNLRQAIYNIRSLFPSTVEPLEASRQDVRLSSKLNSWVDVLAFEEALEQSTLSETADPHLLTEAAGLYRGQFLDGFHVKGTEEFEDWLMAEQGRLRELAIPALRQLVQSYLARGSFRLGIQYAQKLVNLEPLSEEVHRQLMHLYALSGRRGRALDQYDELERILREELDVEPLKETQELRGRILADKVSIDVGDAGDQGMGPLIPLVGRKAEFERLRRCMNAARSGKGLITLVAGEGGMGKSRLIKSFLDSVGKQRNTVILKGRCFDEVPTVLDPFSKVMSNVFTHESEHIRKTLERSSDLKPALSQLASVQQFDVPPTPNSKRSVKKTRDEIFTAVSEFLTRACDGAAAGSPVNVVLMLDDLDWADPAAIELLQHLRDSITAQPVWIVGAYNPRSLDKGHPLSQLAEELQKSEPDHHIELHRLDETHFAEIATALVGMKAAPKLESFLAKKATGRPLDIVEWINFLWDEGLLRSDLGRWYLDGEFDEASVELEGLDELVSRRIENLPASTKRVASLAALSGPSFESDFITKAANEHSGVVDIGFGVMLEKWMIRHFAEQWQVGNRERDLVSWSQGAKRGVFEFSSKQVRHAICRMIQKSRRQVIHAEIGCALEEVHHSHLVDYAELLAYHFGQAKEHAKAWGYCLKAGDRARDVAATQTARRYYEDALHHLDELLSAEANGSAKTWEQHRACIEKRLRALPKD